MMKMGTRLCIGLVSVLGLVLLFGQAYANGTGATTSGVTPSPQVSPRDTGSTQAAGDPAYGWSAVGDQPGIGAGVGIAPRGDQQRMSAPPSSTMPQSQGYQQSQTYQQSRESTMPQSSSQYGGQTYQQVPQAGTFQPSEAAPLHGVTPSPQVSPTDRGSTQAASDPARGWSAVGSQPGIGAGAGVAPRGYEQQQQMSAPPSSPSMPQAQPYQGSGSYQQSQSSNESTMSTTPSPGAGTSQAPMSQQPMSQSDTSSSSRYSSESTSSTQTAD